jgi:hypothetical protein
VPVVLQAVLHPLFAGSFCKREQDGSLNVCSWLWLCIAVSAWHWHLLRNISISISSVGSSSCNGTHHLH